jgi:hypothetical protein
VLGDCLHNSCSTKVWPAFYIVSNLLLQVAVINHNKRMLMMYILQLHVQHRMILQLLLQRVEKKDNIGKVILAHPNFS